MQGSLDQDFQASGEACAEGGLKARMEDICRTHTIAIQVFSYALNKLGEILSGRQDLGIDLRYLGLCDGLHKT